MLQPPRRQVGRGRLTSGVVATLRRAAAASPASRAVSTAPRTSTVVAEITRAVSRIDRRACGRSGIHKRSGGRGSESISWRKTRSMLSSGNIPHLRAHARFRLSEGRAHGPGLHAELPRDFAVVEAQIEL